jgi:proline iminopeptidase
MLQTVNGIDIYYELKRCSGVRPSESNRSTVVLLHGGPGMDHTVFKPAFDPLCKYVDVVYYDHRGCGQSADGARSKWNLAQWAEDVKSFLDHTDIKKPIVLGTSFGGLVAQQLAVAHPQSLGGLVLMSTAAKADVTLCVSYMERFGGKKAAAAAAAFFSNSNEPGVVEKFQELCIPLYAHKGVNWDILNNVTYRPEVSDHFFAAHGEFHSFDFSHALGSIDVSTLVVHGKKDVVFPYPLAEELFKNLKSRRKELVGIRDCGHFSEQDAPQRIIDAILDFFRIRRKG